MATKEDKPEFSGILDYLIKEHLWIFAIWVVPISVVYDFFWYLRTR